MKCCENDMKDFSFYANSDIRVPHFYCSKCGKHYFRGGYYTTDEWFFYINEVHYTNKELTQ